MATKLHELLAVEPDLRTQAETCRADLKNTFEKKSHHFTKKVVTFKSKSEGVPDKIEGQLGLQTTVRKEMDWISEKLAKAMDAGHQIDCANAIAKADVVLEDGSILVKGVLTTSLMRMEHKIEALRELLKSVPTLDPAKGFAPDPDEGAGIYRARDEEKFRGEKQFEFVVMVPPSDKHPAQVKELMVDRQSGVAVTQEWSSLITVGEKGDMLDRVEEMLRAVKKARSKANSVELDVHENKIGDTVLKFVISGARP